MASFSCASCLLLRCLQPGVSGLEVLTGSWEALCFTASCSAEPLEDRAAWRVEDGS